jgi:hypothetical protein
MPAWVVIISLAVLSVLWYLADLVARSSPAIVPAECPSCRGRGTVPNMRLQVFEDCPVCTPAEVEVSAPVPSPRSRTSPLAERL